MIYSLFDRVYLIFVYLIGQTLDNGEFTDRHPAVDLVHAPPDGHGNPTEFVVRAQHDGVVVDAGPSGITGRFILDNLAINPLEGRSGTFYDPEQHVLYAAVTWQNDGDPDNNDDESPANGYEYADPYFGLRVDEVLLLTSVGGTFRTGGECPFVVAGDYTDQLPPLPGCTGGPDRQPVIWYDSNLNDAYQPDIQTIYYHIGVDQIPQYQIWHDQCSDTDRQSTWEKAVVNLEISCRVAAGDPLGYSRWIGWSSAVHLHYEVWIDRNGSGIFEKDGKERDDPLTAFQTFR